MSATEDIRNSVRELAKGNAQQFSVPCLVDNINTTDMTCDCEPIDGSADFLGVRLMANVADGYVLIPKDQSIVMVTPINKMTGFVSMVSEIDKVICYIDSGNKYEFSTSGFIFNGGTLDGMVKVNDLVTKINALENLVNSILTVLKATVIPLAPSGTYPFASLYTAISAITPITVKADLENTKIKQ